MRTVPKLLPRARLTLPCFALTCPTWPTCRLSRASPDASELGYGLSAVELLGDDASLDGNDQVSACPPTSSLSALLRRRSGEVSLSSLVRGPESLGSLLERQGYASTPSSSRPVPVSEEALRSTLSAALAGTETNAPAPVAGEPFARRTEAQADAVTDVLEDLLVRHGYAESKLHASVGAAALLPFTRQDSWVEVPVAMPNAGGCEEAGGQDASGTSREEGDFDRGSSVIYPPIIESGLDGQSDVEGVYFGGAYTLRCYGIGAEVRVLPSHTRCRWR